jgi:adenosylcobinamide-phosphate synthase
MLGMEHVALLILVFIGDALLGDPPWLPHPVRLIGKAIERGEQWLRRTPYLPLQDFLLGLSLVLIIVLGAYFLTVLSLQVLGELSWWLEQTGAVFLGSLCLARRSLKEHASAVYLPLAHEDLDTARLMLARIVSRDTRDLSESEIIRGTLESVAENSSDGVIAPLFYLALGGVPLAFAYKAINTLDSMLGYRTERYEYFGKVAARLDDIANLLPARLTALALAGSAKLLNWVGFSYDGAAAWRSAWRDGHKHASPNAGYPEAALAGAVGVRLGGPSRYFGEVIAKPTLGDARHPLASVHIPRSLVLLDGASLLVLVLFVAILIVTSGL